MIARKLNKLIVCIFKTWSKLSWHERNMQPYPFGLLNSTSWHGYHPRLYSIWILMHMKCGCPKRSTVSGTYWISIRLIGSAVHANSILFNIKLIVSAVYAYIKQTNAHYRTKKPEVLVGNIAPSRDP